nr:MAG TPA: hypothetical protein [Caudoviricetes sp.]
MILYCIIPIFYFFLLIFIISKNPLEGMKR